MRRSLLALGFMGCLVSGYAQKPMHIKMKNPVICYATHVNCESYVPPPQEYLEKQRARTKSATIEVTYSIGFPAQAITAFEHAVDIWETLITSPVPIKIQANWSDLNEGVLGSAIYWSAYANFKGAQKLNVFYPVALAEKIAGEELNEPADFEIFANFNANTDWYFETTGTPGVNQFDFVTVVLHEIAHGLGFSSSFDVEDTQGSVGAFGTEIPIIFDVPVENNSSVKLVGEFNSPSTELKTQLTSNTLRINVLKNSTGNAKLYAPTIFDAGSSISHLDEVTYSPSNDPTSNALMTPQIGFQEVNHNPGPLAFGILSDLGWETVTLDHQPLPNTESLTGPYTATVILTNDDDVQYVADQVKLHYTSNGTDYTTISMSDQGANTFTAGIPTPPNIPWAYGYYISVGDNVGRIVLMPGKIVTVGDDETQNLFVFEIGPDTQHPKILHVPQPYLKDSETELEIRATISDNIGIGSASVEYAINNGAPVVEPLTLIAPQEDSVYTVVLNLGTLTNGDQVTYKVTAIDNSQNPKSTTSPVTGFHTVDVVGFSEPMDSYINDFSAASDDFFGSGFSITTPAGFSDPAIHSTHPYPEGDPFPNDQLELIYILKSPIRVSAENPRISFSEVVLVEPGEAGSIFGDDDFWDYVIVEGTTDFGETWVPLLNGYDSREKSEWLSRYNSSFSGNNSTATGNSTLFRSRSINLTNSFEVNDEVVIRFRLFSDQLAAGWGWAIDNLRIQGPITSTEKELEAAISVFPNPARENIYIEAEGLSSPYFTIQLMNAQGQAIYTAQEEGVNGNMNHTISTQALPQGFYFVKISNEGSSIIRKVIKMN